MTNMKNFVQLIGRLGQDPEFKSLENGNSLVRFSVATDESYKDKSGQKVDRSYWHNVVAWGKTADLMKDFLQKGSKVVLKGKLVQRSYDAKDGSKRYITEIEANEFVSMEKKEVAPF